MLLLFQIHPDGQARRTLADSSYRSESGAARDFSIMHLVEDNEQNSVRGIIDMWHGSTWASVLTVRTQATIEPPLLTLSMGGDECQPMSLGPSTCEICGPKNEKRRSFDMLYIVYTTYLRLSPVSKGFTVVKRLNDCAGMSSDHAAYFSSFVLTHSIVD